MVDVVLTGCRPEPLASYLKALGVLRLVAEQKDPEAQGFWQGEHFVLRSCLDADALTQFFMNEWKPTPLVAPWNGRSGFTSEESDEEDAEEIQASESSEGGPLSWILNSSDVRLAPLKNVAKAIFAWPDLPPADLKLGVLLEEAQSKLRDEKFAESKPGRELSKLVQGASSSGDRDVMTAELPRSKNQKDARKLLTAVQKFRREKAKQEYIERTRSTLSDQVVEWLDTVVVGGEQTNFSALLGSGANDGSLDFTKSFFVRLKDAWSEPSGVSASLFGTVTQFKSKGSLGLFQPQLSESKALTNPWDVVLCLEGTLFFAGAATRRLTTEHSGASFPFQARRMSTTSFVEGEGARDELWLPLWAAASTARELKHFFAEGRARVGERAATTGLDFARAVSTLGVDRGVDAMVRVSMTARNGKAHFATPQARVDVRSIADVRLLDELDNWFEQLRRATSGQHVPAAVARAARGLEDTMFSFVGGVAASELLLALSAAEQALARSLSFASKAVPPAPLLSESWRTAVAPLLAASAEARLGAALAQRPGFRRRFLPLDEKSHRRWGKFDRGVVFAPRALVDNLHALLLREDVEAAQSGAKFEVRGVATPWRDIVDFIDGNVDDQLVEQWAMAATLLPPLSIPRDEDGWRDAPLPPAAFAVCRLVMFDQLSDGQLVKRVAMMMSRACAGDAVEASGAAMRRLNGLGRSLPVSALVESSARMRRIAAAFAFPLSDQQRRRLESMVLPSSSIQEQQ